MGILGCSEADCMRDPHEDLPWIEKLMLSDDQSISLSHVDYATYRDAILSLQ